jgi:hypothetical protein
MHVRMWPEVATCTPGQFQSFQSGHCMPGRDRHIGSSFNYCTWVCASASAPAQVAREAGGPRTRGTTACHMKQRDAMRSRGILACICTVIYMLYIPAHAARATMARRAGRGTAPLIVTLNPTSSDKPFSVAEVQQDSLPDSATWFRVRPSLPTADPSNWHYGDKCWFHRTAPKNASAQQGPTGVQQLPFSALADAAPGTNITLVVEAWSDRNDLKDGSKGVLLATSGALTFTYDDNGFSSKASFVNFTAVQTMLGSITVSAQPEDTGFYQYVLFLLP